MNSFEEVRARYTRSLTVGGVAGACFLILLLCAAGVLVFASLDLFVGIWMEILGDESGVISLGSMSFGRFVLYLIAGFLVLAVVGVVLADRIVPAVVGARRAGESEVDRRIGSTVEAVALAAGLDPIVYVIDADWVNVASLGLRGRRPVVLFSSATAGLDEADRQVVAALGLTDGLLGGKPARLMFGLRVPFILFTWIAQRFGKLVLALTVLQGLGLALTGNLSELFLPAVSLFCLGFVWMLLLTVNQMAQAFAQPADSVADVGAISLLRHPEQWRHALITFGTWTPAAPSAHEETVHWLIPRHRQEFQERYTRLIELIPAAGYSLAGEEFPAELGLDESQDRWQADLSAERRHHATRRPGDIDSINHAVATVKRTERSGTAMTAAVAAPCMLVGGTVPGVGLLATFAGLPIAAGFDLGRDATVEFAMAAAAVVAFATTALIVLVFGLMANSRFPVFLTGAKRADSSDSAHAVLLDTMATVGGVIETDPLLYVVEADWLNVAYLGRRAGRSVVLMTSAVARLAEPDRQVVAALGLSSEMVASGRRGYWTALRVPLIVWKLVGRRGWWLYVAAQLAQVVLLVRTGNAPVVGWGLVVGFFAALAGIVTAGFLVFIDDGFRDANIRYHPIADLGALAFLGRPLQWRNALVAIGSWGVWMPSSYEPAANWLLPDSKDELKNRFEALVDLMPEYAPELERNPLPIGIGPEHIGIRQLQVTHPEAAAQMIAEAASERRRRKTRT